MYRNYLNRWISPDTIIPGIDNPQAWDRYAYSFNNPVKFTDPDGHKPCELACDGDTIDTIAVVDSIKESTGLRWDGLSGEEQRLLKNGGWDAGSFNDHVNQQTSEADFWHDPLSYIIMAVSGGGVGRAASGLVSSLTARSLSFAEGFTAAEISAIQAIARKSGLNFSGITFWRGEGASSSYFASGSPQNITFYDSFFKLPIDEQLPIIREEFFHTLQRIAEYSDDAISIAEEAAKWYGRGGK